MSGRETAEVDKSPQRLDRELQRRILTTAAAAYPQILVANVFTGWSDEPSLNANVIYLHEHGLLEAKWSMLLSEGLSLNAVKATARGMDFLQDDGGLSSILGVVTVKFHEETIRQLLLAKVQQSDAPVTVKARLADAIRSLPAEGLKATTMSLLEAGIDSLPNPVPLLQRLLNLG